VVTGTPIPHDPGLPQMRQLLDAAEMEEVLSRSLHPGSSLSDVAIRYLRYKPGVSLCVHYSATVSGERADAVAYVAPAEDLQATVRRPDYGERARRVAGRTPVRDPLRYDPLLAALVLWLPFELDLPALAEPPEAVRDRLIAAGAPLAGGSARLEMLQYRPRRRAALRLDGHVVKLYRNEAGYRAGVAGLEAARQMSGVVRTASCVAVVPDWLLTLQELLPGDPPPSRAAIARDAGALLAGMHRVRLDGLPPLLPAHRLKAAAVAVEIVKVVAPSLASRAQALLRELESTAPVVGPTVASHGDFHGGQLLIQPDGIALIDFDLLGAAPAAFDLATFAGHLVPVEAAGIAEAASALDDLVEGYGARPPHLSWYLSASILRRARVPFRNFDPDWPAGVETMISAAEAALRL
jgi:hypothetical protein